ncbi:class I SAM-dependent methyltransferase [Calothrix sp. 336/3]|uniref:class I SAM-dependent methyltransferase n=1 Tax=Calothrix sp. 336/3 TaxID=1337936 RepID=UPI0004E3AF77|nr:class I SAM-dependent methyltransferase [Calothrix sp. 336/3]AKG22277.1 methyltransferase [Calothrix sp. 336/3]
MSTSWEKDYPLVTNLSEADLDDNSSLKKMLHLVGENKQVIDFGCATGYFAKLLAAKNCQVTGIELNPKAAKMAEKYCEKVIVADLDYISLEDILSSQIFDVAVFGDILEHLRNPWKVLTEIRNFLNPDGYIVASIPNIAHGAVRLNLLQGKFEYTNLGILDDTHLRFFTRETIYDLLEKSGYLIDVMERITLPIFSGSNWIPHLEKNQFDQHILEMIEQDEEADTFQYIIKAFPISIENKYIILQKKYTQVLEQLENYYQQYQQSNQELEKSNIRLENTQQQLQENSAILQGNIIQLEEARSQLESTHAQLHQMQSEIERSQQQLQTLQNHWEGTQIQLQQAHQGWESCQQIIQAMESSKFWRLRKAWFRVKQFLGIRGN